MLDLDIEKAGWSTCALGDVDHRIVTPPYIRLDSFKKGKNGDYIFKYDFRFTKPNKVFMSSDIVHSLEHFLLVGLRNNVENFAGVAPMGCHTGFYVFLLNEYDSAYIISSLSKVLTETLTATAVPLATEVTCGRADMHNLEGAKAMAKQILAHKDEWLNVFAHTASVE